MAIPRHAPCLHCALTAATERFAREHAPELLNEEVLDAYANCVADILSGDPAEGDRAACVDFAKRLLRCMRVIREKQRREEAEPKPAEQVEETVH